MPKPSDTRDTELDYYRGGAMIWVILIHALYWPEIISNSNLYKSYLLFEMPLIFFITGAGNSFKKQKNVLFFYESRLKRIIIPFALYAAIAFFVFFAYAAVRPGPFSPAGAWPAFSILTWHLWFIPVYVWVITLFPFLRLVYEKLPGLLKYTPPMGFAVLIYLFDQYHGAAKNALYYIPYILFYGFWAYLGIFYLRFKAKPWPRYAIAVVGILAWGALYLLIRTEGYSANMQVNKFPPNTAFLFMSLGTFSLLVLLKEQILRFFRLPPFRNITDTYAAYGYTVYLYHPFGFLLLKTIVIGLNLNHLVSAYKFLAISGYFFINILLGLLFAKIFGRVEKASAVHK